MRLALFQMTSGIDAASNGDAIAAAMDVAADGGADALLTPEMSLLLDRDRERAAVRAEADYPEIAVLRKNARELNLWLHLGLPVKQGDKRRNRTLVIAPNGEIAARYDKIHLFDVDLATGESWRESRVYEGGDAPVLVEMDEQEVGLSICYDIRFPALYRTLAEAGAGLLTIPAAFTVPTGRAHWHVLARARAIETGCFVAAPAQVGRHEDGRETFGHSVVIDPWGRTLLDMEQGRGVGFADIDFAAVARARVQVPALANARPIPSPVRRGMAAQAN
ncbi:carbon-nitrogen hydrolase family protein [Novosphingopyxis sp.]|uniref:carbon-nitrogen hydrolase family protein n=1 Tax=Novosphingopyxis sp. TaxID=2709690 RepID=UPI003B5AF0DA